MSSSTSGPIIFNPTGELVISALYTRLIDSWNQQDASSFAALIEDDGNVVGYDGSQLDGRTAIGAELSQIFSNHKTAAFIAKIREVRFLTSETAVLRAIVGMVPLGKTDLNPAVNAIQTLVAVKRDGEWRIALFQNTPAQFHGRPELVEAMTVELRELL